MATATKTKKEYVGKERIAQLFGLTGRRIEQLVADGVIKRARVGNTVRFDLDDTVHRYIKFLSDKAYGKEESKTETELKEQKLRAEVALKESQGELHRLRTEIATGNYISIEEVTLDYSKFIVVFKNFATSIPSQIAGQLSGVVDPVEIRKIENELKKKTAMEEARKKYMSSEGKNRRM